MNATEPALSQNLQMTNTHAIGATELEMKSSTMTIRRRKPVTSAKGQALSRS